MRTSLVKDYLQHRFLVITFSILVNKLGFAVHVSRVLHEIAAIRGT